MVDSAAQTVATEAAEELSQLAHQLGVTVAVAESLTSGAVASVLGRAPASSDWFCGSVVAYRSSVKHDLLRVPEGPVVSATAVEAMAQCCAELFGADLAVAVSGVGGPEEQEGNPVGTVWFGLCSRGTVTTERRQFSGDPAQIVHETVARAVQALVGAARGLSDHRESTG
jgi:nicotinamide-nucleotide amidase